MSYYDFNTAINQSWFDLIPRGDHAIKKRTNRIKMR